MKLYNRYINNTRRICRYHSVFIAHSIYFHEIYSIMEDTGCNSCGYVVPYMNMPPGNSSICVFDMIRIYINNEHNHIISKTTNYIDLKEKAIPMGYDYNERYEFFKEFIESSIKWAIKCNDIRVYNNTDIIGKDKVFSQCFT